MISQSTSGPRVDRPAATRSGLLMVVLIAGVVAIVAALRSGPSLLYPVAALAILSGLVVLAGLVIVQLNQARVLVVFGSYRGTVGRDPFHFVHPLAWPRSNVSLRLRNFTTPVAKVNDATGNPIEIAAVVVWRVVDAAAAVFNVDDYVGQQSETALRHLASGYPYDDPDHASPSLRAKQDEVAAALQRELATRLAGAGVEVVETRLSHLAYAPEIAEAMLRRQQASAILSARGIIVDGAVGIVRDALARIDDEGITDLDPERRAQMVSNLLVVLASDHHAQPVVNAGSLY